MFNYFLPGINKSDVAPGDVLDRDVLARSGLEHVLSDVKKIPAHASVEDVKQGPDGKWGCVIAPVRKHHGVPDVSYNPRFQTWQPAGRYWLGWKNGEMPTPELLERWQKLHGWEIVDRQNHKWMIPVARAPREDMAFGTLPQTYSFDAAGEPQSHLDPEWLWLWNLAGAIRDWNLGQDAPAEDATPSEKAEHQKPPFSWLIKQAAVILGVNYRVGLAELAVLHGLGMSPLTNATVCAITNTLYGWETEEEAKKKLPAGSAGPAPNSSPSTTGASTQAVAPGTDLAEEH